MGVLSLFFVTILLVPCVLGQEQGDCFGAGSVAGAAIGGFIAALILIAAAYYFKKLYWNERKGKHLVFTTDPESVKDEFAFDNPGFRQEERLGWRHEAPTLPMPGKQGGLHAEFTKPERARDDEHAQKPRVRKVKLWARDFTGLGLTCSGGAREGVHINSVLRSGPAAAAKLQPGDKIKSIKIELIGTPLEDAVTIMSVASPYPVELEVVEGARGEGGRGAGRGVQHPLLKRAGSTSDVNTLEKEARLLHPTKSPDTSHSNNSTLETKHKTGIKKIITEKIITTAERKKEKKDNYNSTLERENEKNTKHTRPHSNEAPVNLRPERNRHSSGAEVQIIQQENGIGHNSVEHAEMQKRESDPRRGMKFGIRVLPPNVPDDGVLKQKSVENGDVTEIKSVDVIDKPSPPRPAPPTQIRHEIESEPKKPVVAKRREKIAPPIPNARTKHHDSDINLSRETSKASDTSSNLSRGDLNSSGIKRDENGIPQEIPQHMMNAANVARNNRKSAVEPLGEKEKALPEPKKEEAPKPKKEEAPKPTKKSKGKAPSPPDREKNKTDDSMLEQMKNIYDFLSSEKHHSSLLHDSSFVSKDKFETSYNTSTPKVKKSVSQLGDSTVNSSIGFSQEEIDEMVGKPFKRESDSLNNYFEDSRSNFSSNLDVRSVVSFNQSDKSDKGSTTIELNNSDVTIHSSPLNDTMQSTPENASLLDENERKAASLGDLSRFELRTKSAKPATGTLERAQSLDISADEMQNVNESTLSPKKRKAMSVVESTFYDTGAEDVLPDMIDSEKSIVIKHKEPRLSLNITKTSAIEGLNTFQKNRLKKGSEFGNLEDAIVKGSSSSIESDKNDSHNSSNASHPDVIQENESHETSDHLAKRIMDENLKVHLKLVSEFAKTTSDGSETLSSFENEQEVANKNITTMPEKVSSTYDTNIPDDMKVSRSSYVNSLERPKSDLMKKLLAKNPILNVHIDQQTVQNADNASSRDVPQKSLTDSFKSTMHQPDIVNFDLKTSEPNEKDFDDFVSTVKVGSNNNTLNKQNKHSNESEWTPPKSTSHIVTVNKQMPDSKQIHEQRTSYTKSIEIGEPTLRKVPDVIDGIKRLRSEKDATLYMEPANMSMTMTQEPVQKTVTVNVTEDEFGNKVITQNIEKISTKYITGKTEAPLQVEQISVGMMKHPGDISKLDFEDSDVKNIDKKFLEEIKRQNPNMVFTSDEPSYTKTETIILNTADLSENQAKTLMERFKNDPTFMADKTPEELSKMGVKIIRELDNIETKDQDTVEMTKTSYSINPAAFTPTQSDPDRISADKTLERKDDHITEITVVTPRTEKSMLQSEVNKNKIASRQRAPPLVEPPPLEYELDIEMLSDFIANERHHTARQMNEIKKRSKTNASSNEPKTRHADYDLPRNTQIKFRTSTYEPPKGTIITSTDLENRRLSQLDQMHLRGADQSPQKPAISAKPSNIPVKSPTEKPKLNAVTSKIPVFSQKSLSQENLYEKNFSLPRSPPPQLNSGTTNITVTSIKSSSKSPSGGKM